MSLIIRTVRMSDLDAIVELESSAFDMPQEMTRKDMIGRIENYPDTFLVAQKDGKVVGHVFGPAAVDRYIKDELYFKNHPNRKEDQYQTILSLAVLPEVRKNGIATQLLMQMDKIAKKAGRKAVSLTCLPELFNFYEKRGFVNEGKTSEDIPDPDGVSSYNMVKELK
ncbi:GNAT family N-acetyltransferase [uncultured Lactobacillus sp.]|uniref:GNAT family N-acetyltransferase n=1 Tax=uncultured Lactobacillus sp. TaxID=153152 RepID=UPI002620DDCE|nr:GNAT family N-acetyltransferase [uncultured Lactobacillus sp.]